MAPRFKAGDLLEVHVWDQGDDIWQDGIVLITEYQPHYKHTTNGVYKFKCIKGNASWISFNSDSFDRINTHIWIGNIADDATLKVLYGQ